VRGLVGREISQKTDPVDRAAQPEVPHKAEVPDKAEVSEIVEISKLVKAPKAKPKKSEDQSMMFDF
jgi:hypothetical protein